MCLGSFRVRHILGICWWMKFQHILARARCPILGLTHATRWEEAFHSIPERFKRWRWGWEEIPRRICGRPGVPKEQDQLRERYTSPRCLFFLLPICSVSVDIGMLISECGVETNWGEAAMYLRWGGEKWCFLRARIDTSGSDRGHILSVLIKYNQAGHNTSPTVLSFILD